MTHPDTLTIPRAVVEQALEGFDRIRRYGLDTLSGRTDGPDDRDWQRDAVNEMTKRARLSEEALRAALQPQAAEGCGEAGCAEGRCGTTECLPSFKAKKAAAEPVAGYVLVHRKVLNKLGISDSVVDTIAAQSASEQHEFNDESPFCVKCGSTGEDSVQPVAHILPRMLKILKFKSMPVPVDPLPYDNGEEKTVPLYTTPPATQAAPVSLQPVHDSITVDLLNDRVMRQQAALTAAPEALKAMQSYAASERKGLKICDDAIAQIEALKGPTP